MEIKVNIATEEIAVIHLDGKFTIEDVQVFKEKTNPLLKDTQKTILMDFAEVTYIDSSGIGSLILLMNSSKNLNINLIIYNLSKEILNVFKIAYLDKFFHISSVQDMKKIFPGVTL